MKRYIIYKCKICECEFILPKEYIRVDENKENYISCPYKGHRKINVIGAYDNIEKAMDYRIYRRVNRRIHQKG